MVSCGLACPGGGGAGVSGCEFRSGWGWDRRCQDPGARGLGPGGGGPYHMGGGGSNTEHGTIHIYIYMYTYKHMLYAMYAMQCNAMQGNAIECYVMLRHDCNVMSCNVMQFKVMYSNAM